MKKAICGMVCTAMLMMTTASARGQQNDIPNDTESRVAPEEFPIFPWDNLKPSKAVYEEARDCGFNLAGFVHPQDLEIAHAAGLKCFVYDPQAKAHINTGLSDEQVAAQVNDLVARTSKYSEVFGYHIIDEPPKGQVAEVARWTRAFEKAAPGAVAYVNLLPIGSAGMGTDTEYEKYLTSYIEEAKPKAFSFDHYCLTADGGLRPNYFQCLEVARRVSLKTDVPFWHVGLAIAHFQYAEPSPTTLRFQIFTSLAYGARGMGWFTYSGRDRGNYRSAALDLFGHRTPTWEMLRDANLQLHRLAPVYTKLKSVGVFHHPTMPTGCRGIDQSRFLTDVRGDGPFVVGEFEDPQGRPALVVVNCNLQRSTHFAVVPKTKATILRVSSFTGQIRPWAAEDDWLAPGQGILLILDK